MNEYIKKKQMNETQDVPSSLFLHYIVKVGFHVSVIIVTPSITIGTEIIETTSVRIKKKELYKA